MDLYYICAKGTRPEHLINARSAPEVKDDNILMKIYTTGVKARMLPNISQDVDGKMWSKFYILHNQLEVWIRDDVYTKFLIDERKILDVEYVGQNDMDSDYAAKDCGISATLMLMKYGGYEQKKTVDELAIEAGLGKDQNTHFKHILQLLNRYSFKPQYKDGFLITDVMQKIKEGIPVLCLINYNQLFSNKFFAHFVVACGYDQEFIYCQDSYNSVKYINYPILKFSKALANVGNMYQNKPYQVVYVNYTKEQLDSKSASLLNRIIALEDKVKLLIDEVQKLKGA